MGFFKKKKKKVNIELDQSFDKVINEINNIDDKDNPKKIEHYILDSCEHIISTAKEVESAKNQYNLVNEKLEDVEKLYNMPQETFDGLKDVSLKVYKLTKKKQMLRESERKISDDMFVLMQQHEESVVEDIHRMGDNEKYKDRISNDIKYLEAEKSRIEIEKEDLSILLNRLRMTSVAIFIIVIAIVSSFIVLSDRITDNIRLVLLLIVFIGMTVSFVIFLFVNKKRIEYKLLIKKLNQNINLLNVERMRYVNVDKALKYELEIYGVKSAAELSLYWEQYMQAVRDLESYRKNNLDLAYYIEKLYDLFKSLELKDERNWIDQVEIILDKDKITSLRLRLLEKKKLIKDQIDAGNNMIKSERIEIDKFMKEHSFYVPEVIEIINSVDAFCEKTIKEINI